MTDENDTASVPSPLFTPQGVDISFDMEIDFDLIREVHSRFIRGDVPDLPPLQGTPADSVNPLIDLFNASGPEEPESSEAISLPFRGRIPERTVRGELPDMSSAANNHDPIGIGWTRLPIGDDSEFQYQKFINGQDGDVYPYTVSAFNVRIRIHPYYSTVEVTIDMLSASTSWVSDLIYDRLSLVVFGGHLLANPVMMSYQGDPPDTDVADSIDIFTITQVRIFCEVTPELQMDLIPCIVFDNDIGEPEYRLIENNDTLQDVVNFSETGSQTTWLWQRVNTCGVELLTNVSIAAMRNREIVCHGLEIRVYPQTGRTQIAIDRIIGPTHEIEALLGSLRSAISALWIDRYNFVDVRVTDFIRGTGSIAAGLSVAYAVVMVCDAGSAVRELMVLPNQTAQQETTMGRISREVQLNNGSVINISAPNEAAFENIRDSLLQLPAGALDTLQLANDEAVRNFGEAAERAREESHILPVEDNGRTTVNTVGNYFEEDNSALSVFTDNLRPTIISQNGYAVQLDDSGNTNTEQTEFLFYSQANDSYITCDKSKNLQCISARAQNENLIRFPDYQSALAFKPIVDAWVQWSISLCRGIKIVERPVQYLALAAAIKFETNHREFDSGTFVSYVLVRLKNKESQWTRYRNLSDTLQPMKLPEDRTTIEMVTSSVLLRKVTVLNQDGRRIRSKLPKGSIKRIDLVRHAATGHKVVEETTPRSEPNRRGIQLSD